ncbi:Kelch-type beta propeller [Cynara cardunculus var. scolymus]|uniref:Kelch-type beta propeller n=1 Tax=Cynara cardunculus var. scolymus TaxID=59895 RepID=A0A103YL19_CYNCS|nr:Kelch-type beta propeller [Cynara cardunculus var. scolymus]
MIAQYETTEPYYLIGGLPTKSEVALPETKTIPSENGNSGETQDKDVMVEGLGSVGAYDQWVAPPVSGPPAVVDDKMYIFGGNHHGRYINDLQETMDGQTKDTVSCDEVWMIADGAVTAEKMVSRGPSMAILVDVPCALVSRLMRTQFEMLDSIPIVQLLLLGRIEMLHSYYMFLLVSVQEENPAIYKLIINACTFTINGAKVNSGLSTILLLHHDTYFTIVLLCGLPTKSEVALPETKTIPSENGNSGETQDKDVMVEGLGSVGVYDQWVAPPVSGPRPKPRYEHAAAVVDDKMYIFGGNHNGRYLNDLQERMDGQTKDTVSCDEVRMIAEKMRPWEGNKLISFVGHSEDPSEVVEGLC